jgi:hypothetical protein
MTSKVLLQSGILIGHFERGLPVLVVCVVVVESGVRAGALLETLPVSVSQAWVRLNRFKIRLATRKYDLQ